MPLENINLDSPDLAAVPEQYEVDWASVRQRVELSIDEFGLHSTKEHYFAAVSAYEDQLGDCSDHVSRDIIPTVLHKVISERF